MVDSFSSDGVLARHTVHARCIGSTQQFGKIQHGTPLNGTEPEGGGSALLVRNTSVHPTLVLNTG
jgi:hypothetical protein